MGALEWHLVSKDDDVLLPIPPSKYTINEGKNNSSVDIVNFGELNIKGGSILTKLSISSFFPAHKYDFIMGTYQEPQNYVNKFRNWMENDTVFSLFILGSEVAKMFSINNFNWGEEDGTGDIYYTMDLIEDRSLNLVNSDGTTNSSGSSSDTSSGDGSSLTLYGLPVGTYAYTVDEGDTLIQIAKWYYGDSSRWQEIASRNNISNPDLIYTDQVIYL
ncbi:LysM peptidoglycan-binding domain-containing protein [Clostridium beijerinckii]|uniref:LysM peptidoglycan-binding domain-containing protein n=1 Tax=Clostridium beijerinckii TaxID=1520 RepID=UPI00098CA45B|nr:LysM domain-containing protein [Clostridium beijerinckii]NRT78113.1 nucleoid-associated protein YgaU [Clostridium beijerinckii]OOM44806.1 LysM domain/BON superfamily protein [Clostridium beijerinckii]